MGLNTDAKNWDDLGQTPEPTVDNTPNGAE